MNIYELLAKLPTGIKIFGFEIRFYAIFILIGAVLAYILGRYFTRKEGHDDKILENVFYCAFPAGIVGARIWYVIAEWSKEFAHQPFYKVFYIWEGGLAIQGGVILGAVVGIGYIMIKKPHYHVVRIADYCIPGILLAQAIGRLGNFFNAEVYGKCIEESSLSFLPAFVLEQLKYNAQGGYACAPGEIVTPLFLIEALLNTAGFFVIMFGIRKGLKKYYKAGDLIGAYLIWYGTVRAILEPMRNPTYQMGNNLTSVWMSVAFIIGGVALIVLAHIFADKVDAFFESRRPKDEGKVDEQ